MTFVGLMARNIAARPLRSVLTAVAVAIGVLSMLTLGVLTTSLRDSATQVLQAGDRDMTVSQKHADDVIDSTITTEDVAAIAALPGVARCIGVLFELADLDADHRMVVELGMLRDQLEPFGVRVVAGRPLRDESPTDSMLGVDLARSLDLHVGDTYVYERRTYRVVGLFTTRHRGGSSSMLLPLAQLQGRNRVSGQVTIGFVQLRPGVQRAAVRSVIDERFPELVTIASPAEFTEADRSLSLLGAFNAGGSVLAGLIAITGVLNTTLLSFFERFREFGICRAIGWSRRRVLALILGEALVVSIAGAALGVALSSLAVAVLERVGQLRGVFHASSDPMLLGRALAFAVIVAVAGALYPGIRAATVQPIVAVRNE